MVIQTLFSFQFIRNHDFKLYSCLQLLTFYVATKCRIVRECVSTKGYLLMPLLMSISIASTTTQPTNRTIVNILVNLPLETYVRLYFGYLPGRNAGVYNEYIQFYFLPPFFSPEYLHQSTFISASNGDSVSYIFTKIIYIMKFHFLPFWCVLKLL